jgi:hypothetical protein
MPGTVKSEFLSYADRITKCERQEKGRGGRAEEASWTESRTKNGQRSICPWTCAAWKLDKKASSILGGLPPPNPWIPCVFGTRQPCPKSARLVRKLRGYCPAENRMIVQQRRNIR